MKLKTILKRIDILEKEKTISNLESTNFKKIVNRVWDSEFEKHHISGEKDGTPNNRVVIKGTLHYMLHTYAYRFIVNLGMLKNYLLWLNRTFGAEINDLMKKIK